MPSLEFPREYVKPGDTLAEWDEIEPYFDELEARAIGSVLDRCRRPSTRSAPTAT